MNYQIFDFVDANGKNHIKEWSSHLQSKERGKLNKKIDSLAIYGCELFPQMLTNTPTAGILKLRVHGNVQLRPMLCKGTVNVEQEFTLLLGAKEIGDEFEPKNADKIADTHKKELICNFKLRKEHETVS